ncbi:MAG: hypothetical protein ABIH29_02785 [Candidatus Micrarchaeota archaeon]
MVMARAREATKTIGFTEPNAQQGTGISIYKRGRIFRRASAELNIAGVRVSITGRHNIFSPFPAKYRVEVDGRHLMEGTPEKPRVVNRKDPNLDVTVKEEGKGFLSFAGDLAGIVRKLAENESARGAIETVERISRVLFDSVQIIR